MKDNRHLCIYTNFYVAHPVKSSQVTGRCFVVLVLVRVIVIVLERLHTSRWLDNTKTPITITSTASASSTSTTKKKDSYYIIILRVAAPFLLTGNEAALGLPFNC
jgi:hypothetical protein